MIFQKNVKVKITVENYGDIELELYPDVAPVSVRNFAYLAKQGFYDGLIFHRVIDGFMIQGGDPKVPARAVQRTAFTVSFPKTVLRTNLLMKRASFPWQERRKTTAQAVSSLSATIHRLILTDSMPHSAKLLRVLISFTKSQTAKNLFPVLNAATL